MIAWRLVTVARGPCWPRTPTHPKEVVEKKRPRRVRLLRKRALPKPDAADRGACRRARAATEEAPRLEEGRRRSRRVVCATSMILSSSSRLLFLIGGISCSGGAGFAHAGGGLVRSTRIVTYASMSEERRTPFSNRRDHVLSRGLHTCMYSAGQLGPIGSVRRRGYFCLRFFGVAVSRGGGRGPVTAAT